MCGAARQAANAAAAAEGNAMGSTNHARIEQSMASLATAMAAMALFEQARPTASLKNFTKTKDMIYIYCSFTSCSVSLKKYLLERGFVKNNLP